MVVGHKRDPRVHGSFNETPLFRGAISSRCSRGKSFGFVIYGYFSVNIVPYIIEFEGCEMNIRCFFFRKKGKRK